MSGTETDELSLISALLGVDCKTDFDTKGGFLVWAALILYTFYVLAWLCDGHLTGVLEKIVEKLNMSEDVAGATFLAISSSAPELFCSVLSTFVLVSSSGVGNIVGSALFNLLCILGVLPLCSKEALKIWWYPTIRDACFYALSIGELAWVISDGKVDWWESAVMVASYGLYVFYFTQNDRIMKRFGLQSPEDAEEAASEEKAKAAGVEAPEDKSQVGVEVPGASVVGKSLGQLGPEVPADGASEVSTQATNDAGWRRTTSRGSNTSKSSNKAAQAMARISENNSGSLRAVLSGGSGSRGLKGILAEGGGDAEVGEAGVSDENAGDGDEKVTCPTDPSMWVIDRLMPRHDLIAPAFCVVVVWVALFTYLMVDGSGRLGCVAGVPHVVMGLVVLAAGTSVPDTIASISVARDGHADMAAANAVGSNTFDILLGLGLPWFIKTALMGEEVLVPKAQLLECVAYLAFCLVFYVVAIAMNGWLLSRRFGAIMLLLYVLGIAFIIVRHYTEYAVH